MMRRLAGVRLQHQWRLHEAFTGPAGPGVACRQANGQVPRPNQMQIDYVAADPDPASSPWPSARPGLVAVAGIDRLSRPAAGRELTACACSRPRPCQRRMNPSPCPPRIISRAGVAADGQDLHSSPAAELARWPRATTRRSSSRLRHGFHFGPRRSVRLHRVERAALRALAGRRGERRRRASRPKGANGPASLRR